MRVHWRCGATAPSKDALLQLTGPGYVPEQFTVHVQLYHTRPSADPTGRVADFRTVRDSRLPDSLFIVLPDQVVECGSGTSNHVLLADEKLTPRLAMYFQGQTYRIGDFLVSIGSCKIGSSDSVEVIVSISYPACAVTSGRKPVLEIFQELGLAGTPLQPAPYKAHGLDIVDSARHQALEYAYMLIGLV
ncbi:unnamed protein product (mitochondrion) [Plasmodiophora brassicae]|uniref:Mediator of RNA polymerase II transcription subunit 20 n=1 Tax=Plasmodiophora brassicae TaxID=37360 RepID=A0A0G4J438_PLABS|nr:hypothetical protein PBRA_002316 [Plasmodiophora brassicae]SPQ98907.1 unnamed protein product [Plasmodiophora brassicae]